MVAINGRVRLSELFSVDRRSACGWAEGSRAFGYSLFVRGGNAGGLRRADGHCGICASEVGVVSAICAAPKWRSFARHDWSCDRVAQTGPISTSLPGLGPVVHRGSRRIDGPQFVPIDGKTLRGSHGAKDRENPLHLVSAWASAQGLTLGQVAVDDKSNEITAIPKLLEMLELKGAIVSIDAMGCQKEIAALIVAGEGDFLLAVKDNQPQLVAAISAFFLQRHEHNDFAAHGCRQYHTREKSRGRMEERFYFLAPLPETMHRVSVRLAGLVLHRTSRQPHDRGW